MNDNSDDYDLDFGYMQFNGIDAWDCTVSTELPHPPSYYLALHIWGDDSGPTDHHRQTVRWLKQDYRELWPKVAETICKLHPELTDPTELSHAMRDWVSVHIGEHDQNSVELVYDLNLPNEGTRGFFISVDKTGVVDAFVAE